MCLKCALKVGYIACSSYWKLLQCLLTAVVTLVAMTELNWMIKVFITELGASRLYSAEKQD